MSIRLNRRPSTDGQGVQRWTHQLDAFHTLHVFLRPSNMSRHPFLLRLDHIDGRTLLMREATFRAEAIDRAQYIESLVHAKQVVPEVPT